MPLNEEQSVLDYIKARLRFWERSGKKQIPAESGSLDEQVSPDEASSAAQIELVTQVTVESEKTAEPERPLEKVAQSSHLPWRSLIALAFALIGQRAFDPVPQRAVTVGLVFYGFALVSLILAYLNKEWQLAPALETGTGADTMQVRRIPLMLGILSSVAAFLTLGNNLFTLLNVTLWVLAMVFFVRAFWQPGEPHPSIWARLKDFFTRDTWQFKVTRLTLLVLVVVGIVIFFRVYNIGGVPAEPFSDHAEKLLDVYDVSQGHTHIFFPRNTGREAIQMYLTLVVSWIFGTGLTFMSLKIGTIFCGLVTLPYMYLLGKEIGGKRIGLLAVFFAGIAYWPNVISRVGLRFTLYPLFAAPTLYYLLRGLRKRNRNDFIVSGLFLGFGLHGYSPFRIMPFVVVIAIGLYLLHAQSRGNRKQAIIWLSVLAIISLIVFLPLARYWLDNPDSFGMRAFSRLGSVEQPLPGPWWKILLSNTWNSLRMFNWDNGTIWVHSVPGRPAFDIVSAALFLIGAFLVLVRYLRQRHWLDLFLLVSIPLLQLPSTLSLAFPGENPSLNRPAAAFIPAILLVAIALDGLLKSIESQSNRKVGITMAWVVALGLAGWSSFNNYDLVFNQYATEFRLGAWNTSEIADVIRQFTQVNGTVDDAWVVPYPYWVDTRLVGDWLNLPDKDFALWPQDFYTTQKISAAKLFIIKPEDLTDLGLLEQFYPQGILSTFHSAVTNAGKDFLILFIPPVN